MEIIHEAMVWILECILWYAEEMFFYIENRVDKKQAIERREKKWTRKENGGT